MKKIISLLILIIAFNMSAQTPLPNGARFNNATESTDKDDSIKLAVLGENNILNYYTGRQFSSSQKERILDLIYQPNTSSISVSPTSGERGVSTALTVNYQVTANDDENITGSINQGVGSITIDGSSHNISGGSSVVSKTFTMTLDYERQGEAESETKTATYTAHIPQWKGVSSEDDFTTYAGLNSELTKFVQSSAATSMTISPSDEYIWFVSNKSNAVIKDGNGFTQTIGTWGDGVSEFYTKSLSLTLADGSTVETVYLYRTRLTKSFTNLTYTIQ